MELEKIGTKSVLGTYVIEGDSSYIEQEKEGDVNIVGADGTDATVSIKELKEFIKKSVKDFDVRQELLRLASLIDMT